MFPRFGVLLLLTGALGWADILTLKNGRVVEGTFLGGNARQIRVLTAGDKVETIDISDLSIIQFGATGSGAAARPAEPVAAAPVAATPVAATPVGATPVAAAPVSGSPLPVAAVAAAPVGATAPAPPPAAPPPAPVPAPAPVAAPVAPAPTQVPAGTRIMVALLEPVDSKKDKAGKVYRGRIEEGVQNDGRTLVPEGAIAEVRLTSSNKSQLTLDLTSVTFNKKTYAVLTDDVQQAPAAQKPAGPKKSSILGSVGGLAGSAKSKVPQAPAEAASPADAASTAGWESLKGSPRIRVPAEGKLSFKLREPLRL